MLWQYTQRDTKVLLLATLCTFSGYGLLLADNFEDARLATRVGFQGAQTIGIAAQVESNQVNTYLSELSIKEQELAAREAQLNLRENTSTVAPDRLLVIVAIIGITLLGLILLNFYLDSKRRVSLA